MAPLAALLLGLQRVRDAPAGVVSRRGTYGATHGHPAGPVVEAHLILRIATGTNVAAPSDRFVLYRRSGTVSCKLGGDFAKRA